MKELKELASTFAVVVGFGLFAYGIAYSLVPMESPAGALARALLLILGASGVCLGLALDKRGKGDD